MTIHRASCEDCPWSVEDDDLLAVSDEAEAHARKEFHEVDIERAVATDGGVDHVIVSGKQNRTVYHDPDPDAPDQPACDPPHDIENPQRRDPRTLGEGYRYCAWCDPEQHPQGRRKGEKLATRLRREAAEERGEEVDPTLLCDGGHLPGAQPGAAPPPVERGGRDWVCPGCNTAYHGRPDVVDDAGARWRCYCSIACYVEDLQFLGAELHKCDLCDQVFDDVDALVEHDCDPSVTEIVTDGGQDVHSAGDSEHDWKRCKICLNDPDKRVSEVERFGDLNGPQDYAAVLRHALEEHTDSEELSNVVSGVTLTTPCGDCGEPFISEVHISEGLRVRTFCDECCESDPVRELIHRRVSVDEILPEITERNNRSHDTDSEHSDDDLRADGGVPRERHRLRRRDVDSVRQQAGVGDQARCPNGNRDCANGADGILPCFDCLTGGDP